MSAQLTKITSLFIPILLCFIHSNVWAQEPDSATTLDATIYNSCSPWQRSALDIVVESVDIIINIYDDDVAALRSGKVVIIKPSKKNMDSIAIMKDESNIYGSRPVNAEIKIDVKTMTGYLLVEGSTYQLVIEWNMKEDVPCII
jgi:virulence-associated protein VagC